MSLTQQIVPVVVAYLIGSLSFAVIVSRAMGMPDPRQYGSGNPGATNVLRSGRKLAAVLTLLGDAGKGFVAVMLARWVWHAPELVWPMAVGVFLGHLYPLFFGFKGGKGVATALGVLLAASWPVGLLALATWLVMAFLFRISSLSALTAALLAPVYVWIVSGMGSGVAAAAFISALLIGRHRSNIANLMAGREGHIGKGSTGKGSTS
jgi:glycerol-3-phosphate acyltransferase PlsY